MTDTFEFTLDNPLTDEQWDMIADVDFDHTDRIWFHTKHGKEVEFAKVIRCKDCKHMGDVYLVSLPWLEQKEHRCRYWEHPTTPDDYCNRAERKEE